MIAPKFRIFLIIIFILNLAGCASAVKKDGPPHRHVNVSQIPNAVPKKLPRSRYGNPKSYVVLGKRYSVLKSAKGYDERGIASWYGTKFHGQLTSSRKPYDMFAMTGASPVLPIPSFVRVTNLDNGRSVVVKINDRGPFAPNRIIDLSYTAARKLGYANKGTALVEVKDVDLYDDRPVFAQSQQRPKTHPKLFLQLGAFRIFAHAKRLKQRLARAVHEPVVIQKGFYHALPIYRVKIGPLIGVGQLDRIQAKLNQMGFGQAVTEIS